MELLTLVLSPLNNLNHEYQRGLWDRGIALLRARLTTVHLEDEAQLVKPSSSSTPGPNTSIDWQFQIREVEEESDDQVSQYLRQARFDRLGPELFWPKYKTRPPFPDFTAWRSLGIQALYACLVVTA
jgi:hypothetical protein